VLSSFGIRESGARRTSNRNRRTTAHHRHARHFAVQPVLSILADSEYSGIGWSKLEIRGGKLETESAIRADSLTKIYRSGGADVVVFKNLSLQVSRDERLAIIGESGVGKSTLLALAWAA
jgi:ABC-type glutathione transport system ATPase component